jgi:NADPH2:quinone reductase
MKAIVVHEYGGPDVMKLEEVEDPKPAPGQVVVKVHAAGVNPVDTYLRGGLQGYAPPLPFTPGIDGAGTVEAVGEGVTGLTPGDRVYCSDSSSGTYAGKALCGVGHVHPLPDRVSFAQGASVNVPYATAYRALFQRARALPGETVLVHGASGGVGTAAVQLARARGLTVIGTAGSMESRLFVEEQGAHWVLDHHDPGHLDEVVKLTVGRGVDVILEMLANVNLGHDLPALTRGGRVVVIGSRGTVEINPRDTMGRDAGILGMSLRITPELVLGEIHAHLRAGLENGSLDPVVRQEFPFTEAARAHELVMEPGAHGNIVLVP